MDGELVSFCAGGPVPLGYGGVLSGPLRGVVVEERRGPVTRRSLVTDASLMEDSGWLGRDGFLDAVL